MRGGRIGDQREIAVPVLVAEKHRQAPVAALGHMVRDTGNDDAGQSRHAARVWPLRALVNLV